ncbi:3'-5' exonuclease [Microbulbifer sp. THAF38]|uniref:3'-5' exonuclease n=1 Tax=Microbulbifer sp. THAF38 TaxID=2587856 RepID=UPI0012691BC2|nr:3'-5' exonuclease [Microbulbifer sp. THAF38]
MDVEFAGKAVSFLLISVSKKSLLLMKSQVSILIVDLECTCNDAPAIAREEMEIIELGAIIAKLSGDSFLILDERQFYVSPSIHSKLTPFCTDLTGILQDEVDHAPPLAEVLNLFSDWLSLYDLSAWGSWGAFDAEQIQMETGAKALSNPLEYLPHINIKELFSRKRGQRVGLSRALQLERLEFKGRQHSGLDDSRNIAQLLGGDAMLRESVLRKI